MRQRRANKERPGPRDRMTINGQTETGQDAEKQSTKGIRRADGQDRRDRGAGGTSGVIGWSGPGDGTWDDALRKGTIARQRRLEPDPADVRTLRH